MLIGALPPFPVRGEQLIAALYEHMHAGNILRSDFFSNMTIIIIEYVMQSCNHGCTNIHDAMYYV
jgi:hypothetical protein